MPKWSNDPRVDRVSMNIISIVRIAQKITQENGMGLEDAIVAVVGQFMWAESFDEILNRNLSQELPQHAKTVD